MKFVLTAITSIALLSHSTFALASSGSFQAASDQKKITCDGGKVVYITTAYSLNNSDSQDKLSIASSDGKEAVVFARSQADRKMVEDQRASQAAIETVGNTAATLMFGAAIDMVAAATVNSVLNVGFKTPALYEKILTALGKYGPGYKANIGQILSPEEVTFYGLAIPSLYVGYKITHSLYSGYLEAQAAQNSDKLCRGDYSSLTQDKWTAE
ncbi:MAG: hypothetical protein ACXVCY_11075 [Pseudobdellovibrionaceae bacterium]